VQILATAWIYMAASHDPDMWPLIMQTPDIIVALHDHDNVRCRVATVSCISIIDRLSSATASN
jgi:hypothetical protein